MLSKDVDILKYLNDTYRKEMIDENACYCEERSYFYWKAPFNSQPEDKPARIYDNGSIMWRLNGYIGNKSGPAKINILDGRLYSIEFSKHLRIKDFYMRFSDAEILIEKDSGYDYPEKLVYDSIGTLKFIKVCKRLFRIKEMSELRLPPIVI